ncbi:hypothetical protein COV24_00160 [candidate division WWE3 bacterium CG10_big_fil_rev_8_21_14_0_10_32_10]|uniref:Pyrrolo-quinoline quinone repeat domain-containing protein n=1 Tax=candidate division WWE3 bacterium CG10_big_fil_rev_8_21_14_0_10_32_10 TaxID=1975090 RepID=A0A2H0RC27_UNCKA|nr:MAG: hypothetical protein COV24_00160 [candidate division WWE3 bacterium CG10_big_fil_rev_8_21_14_0_10_32_10]
MSKNIIKVLKILSVTSLFILVILIYISKLGEKGLLKKQEQSVEINQVQAQTTSSDWPQYQHDENRTGYNPVTTTKTNFGYVWDVWHQDDTFTHTAQPIVIGNRTYIGSKKGIVYAYDLITGHLDWSRQLDGAINHTLAGIDTAVFAATLNGSVYALDPADGSDVWSPPYHPATPPASFGGALLLVESENSLYVTNRLGKLHALNVADGSEKWSPVSIPGPVISSPTYGNDNVFIGGGDLKMHAVNATSGTVVWTSTQLYGDNFGKYAPVFAENKVIITTAPAVYTKYINQQDHTLMDQANMDVVEGYMDRNANKTNPNYNPFDPVKLVTPMQKTIDWLTVHPRSQTYYVFDANTGAQPYIPSVLHVIANGGAQPPPIYTNRGLETMFHVAGAAFNGCDYYCSLANAIPWGAFGRMDLNTGRIVERYTDSNISSKYTPDEITVDETNNYSAAGDIIIGARCQTEPGCSLRDGSNCSISNRPSHPFPDDLCQMGSAAIYANGYIVQLYQNMIVVYH